MTPIFIGIDPGITGAVAAIHPDGRIELYDTPTLVIVGGKKIKTVYNEREMAAMLRGIVSQGPAECAIERVQAFPAQRRGAAPCPACGRGPMAQGVVGMFAFGEGFGMWKGIMAALGIKYELVSPVTWKGALMAGQGKEKDASRQVALRKFPAVAEMLTRMKDHGRADALLLAEFARRTHF